MRVPSGVTVAPAIGAPDGSTTDRVTWATAGIAMSPNARLPETVKALDPVCKYQYSTEAFPLHCGTSADNGQVLVCCNCTWYCPLGSVTLNVPAVGVVYLTVGCDGDKKVICTFGSAIPFASTNRPVNTDPAARCAVIEASALKGTAVSAVAARLLLDGGAIVILLVSSVLNAVNEA